MKPIHGFLHLDAGGFLALDIRLGFVGDRDLDVQAEEMSSLIYLGLQDVLHTSCVSPSSGI
jgi:hypothetical protein